MQNQVFSTTRDTFSASDRQKLPVRSWAIIRVLCSSVLLTIAPFIAFFFILAITRGYSWIDYLWFMSLLVGLMFFEGAIGVLLSRQLPAHADGVGITSTDWWGRKLSLSWAEISTVQAKQHLNLPYLRIRSFRKDDPVMWLPLYLRPLQELYDAVVINASPNNPVRRFMEGKSEIRR